jgi:CheY-like chemotaxis protein
VTGSPLWTNRTELDVLLDQLQALDRWNARQAVLEATDAVLAGSREAKLDAARRLDVQRQEQAALLARAAQHMERTRAILGRTQARAVIAHRNAWFRDKVAGHWAERVVEVVAAVDNGTEAVAALVIEQPDLVLVEDLLPGLDGTEVLARAHTYAPRAVLATQVRHAQSAEPFVLAGAHAVFSRRIPPVDVALEMLRCLNRQQQGEVVRLL